MWSRSFFDQWLWRKWFPLLLVSQRVVGLGFFSHGWAEDAPKPPALPTALIPDIRFSAWYHAREEKASFPCLRARPISRIFHGEQGRLQPRLYCTGFQRKVKSIPPATAAARQTGRPIFTDLRILRFVFCSETCKNFWDNLTSSDRKSPCSPLCNRKFHTEFTGFFLCFLCPILFIF